MADSKSSTSHRPQRFSAPLAASGALLAALAVVGLAQGYDRVREPPTRPAAPRAFPAALEPAARDPAAPEVARLLDGQRLDVNRATAEELQLLPRIGPTLAARIIEERERGGPFGSLGDLTRVRGIGPRTIERLAPLAAAGDPPEARTDEASASPVLSQPDP